MSAISAYLDDDTHVGDGFKNTPALQSFVRCHGEEVAAYLVPATAPSFFPSGSSSSTPHHSPLAKSVSPT